MTAPAFNMTPQHFEVETAIAEAVKLGMIVHNGEYREGPPGILMPVYVLPKFATAEQIAQYEGKVMPWKQKTGGAA